MSEPFGLFQILQSFLSQTPLSKQENTQPLEQNTAPNPSENVQNGTNLKTDNKTDGNTDNANNQVDNDSASPNNQAILSFMQAHENRAKRIKKP